MIPLLPFAVVGVLLMTGPLWAGPPGDATPLEPQAMAGRIHDLLLARRFQAMGVIGLPVVPSRTTPPTSAASGSTSPANPPP